jgi:hypothetical protein
MDSPDYRAALLDMIALMPPDRVPLLKPETHTTLDALTAEAPHPGEQHQFKTECSKCGAWGQLFVAIIGPDEQALIQQIGPVDGK